jgi:catechol 2,3-dioxygenase-like lactoylglutathione lyase family enzyme
MASTTGTSHIGGVATVAVPVKDHERALDFYCATLGFEKRIDAPFGDGLRWIEVAPAGATTTIALAPPGDVPVGVDTGIRLSTTDCEADHRTLRQRDVEIDEILRWPGVPPMFSLRDPDGNTLYVVESVPG